MSSVAAPYVYDDSVRADILRMIPPDGRVIGTYGCGRAATEATLVRNGREVHGVDISDEAIAVARTRLTTARVISPNDWDCFEPNSLDGLLFADVLEHIPQAWKTLAQLSKAVRPGGWVIISVPNMRSLKVLVQFMLGGDWPEQDTGIYDATHVQMMSQKRLERWLAAANLKPEQWFENYICLGPKQTLLRWIDRLTLRFGHTWFVFQVQVRARKQG